MSEHLDAVGPRYRLQRTDGRSLAFWGVILGFPVLRLRGDYLAIVTLAFGEIIRIVLINWVSLTGGPILPFSIRKPDAPRL